MLHILQIEKGNDLIMVISNINDQQAIKVILNSLEIRKMNQRVERLNKCLQERSIKKQEIWGGSLSVLNENTINFPTAIRRALAFEKVLLEMPITIEPDDIIVGNCVDGSKIARCILPQFMKDEELNVTDISMFHKTPDYETLVNKGLNGVLSEINQKRIELGLEADFDKNKTKIDLLKAMIIEANAAIKMANRYANLAIKLYLNEEDPTRKSELLKISEVCRRVPEFPARTMLEAIQSFWFINYAFFETQTYLACGRLDQLFNPFFKNDVEKGILTIEEGQELIDCLCVRMNDRIQIEPKNYVYDNEQELGVLPKQCVMNPSMGFVIKNSNSLSNARKLTENFVLVDQLDAINHWGQNVLISGIKADKTDGTNAISYMFLNSIEKLSLTSPVLTVRLHKNSPQDLINRVAEVLKNGGGMPYINNDDVITSAYTKLGVKWDDACEYANSNCWETLIQGRSNQEMIRGINFLLYLELALNRGCSLLDDQMLGIDTGDPIEFRNFTELMEAWKKQIDYSLETNIEHAASQILGTGGHGKFSSVPLLSALTKDCIENAKDLTHDGARYTIWHIMGEAASNAADAMAAIKKLVFEEKKVTMIQLLDMLKSNWECSEGKRMREFIINHIPKFGNDIDYVDDLCKEMCDYFLSRSDYYSKKYKNKIIFPCSIGTFSWVISIGKTIGASADGRMNSDPIAANFSPVPGCDISGPTAAINSYLKMNMRDMAAGSPIDLRINKNSVEGKDGTNRLAGIIKTFLEKDGNMITFTIASADELRKAMDEPEKYRNIRVRMGGWSAYFVMLSKEHQLIHIKRIEHAL